MCTKDVENGGWPYDFKRQTVTVFGAQEALSGFDAMSAAASSYVKKAPKQALQLGVYTLWLWLT